MAAGRRSTGRWTAAGLQPRFIQGRRYTDDATLDIVERVLAYETNEHIAARIEEFGGRAMPLNFRTTNVLFGERITLKDDDGEAMSTWGTSAE